MTGSTGLEPATSGLTERDALGCTASPKWCNLLISHGEQWEITRTALLDLVGPNRGGLEGRGHGRKHPRRCNRQVNFRDGQRVETGTGFAREAGCLFRIPFEVSALQPRRRITPPLRKALLVQIGGPQCTVGKHSGPPRIPCPGAVLAPPHALMRFAGNLPPQLLHIYTVVHRPRIARRDAVSRVEGAKNDRRFTHREHQRKKYPIRRGHERLEARAQSI